MLALDTQLSVPRANLLPRKVKAVLASRKTRFSRNLKQATKKRLVLEGFPSQPTGWQSTTKTAVSTWDIQNEPAVNDLGMIRSSKNLNRNPLSSRNVVCSAAHNRSETKACDCNCIAPGFDKPEHDSAELALEHAHGLEHNSQGLGHNACGLEHNAHADWYGHANSWRNARGNYACGPHKCSCQPGQKWLQSPRSNKLLLRQKSVSS